MIRRKAAPEDSRPTEHERSKRSWKGTRFFQRALDTMNRTLNVQRRMLNVERQRFRRSKFSVGRSKFGSWKASTSILTRVGTMNPIEKCISLSPQSSGGRGNQGE